MTDGMGIECGKCHGELDMITCDKHDYILQTTCKSCGNKNDLKCPDCVEHECVFPEEQEPDGRLILAPCLECNTPAIEAVKEAQRLRLRLARMEETLKIISRGWHNQECNHGEVALKALEEDSRE